MSQKIISNIRSLWSRFRIEIIIFCFIFGIRALYALVMSIFFGPDIFVAYSDAGWLIVVAENILNHGVFSHVIDGPLYYPCSLHTPGYPFFLALFLLIKAPLAVIIMVQHVLAGFLGVMMYRIGLRFFKSRFVGSFAVIIFAIEPTSIYWNNLLMSDNLFTFLLFFALYLFCRKRFFWCAFILGLGVLTRPIGLYFFPVFIGMFILMYMRGLYNSHITKLAVLPRQFFLKTTFMLITVFLLVMSPWLIRNKLVFDTLEFSSAGWVNLQFFTATPYAEKYNISLETLQMPADFPIQDEVVFTYDFRNTDFHKNQIFGLFYNNPVRYIAFHVGSAIKGLGNTGYKYLIDYVISVKFSSIPSHVLTIVFYMGQTFWLIILLLLFLGFWRKETRFFHIFLFSFFIVNTLLLGNSANGQGGRYHLPIEPMVLLLAANGAWVVIKMIKTKNIKIININKPEKLGAQYVDKIPRSVAPLPTTRDDRFKKYA